MKLALEVSMEANNLVIKSSVTASFNVENLKLRVQAWGYRVAVAVLLLWPGQCHGYALMNEPGERRAEECVCTPRMYPDSIHQGMKHHKKEKLHLRKY